MERTRLQDERPEAETRDRVFVDREPVVKHAGDLPQKRRDLLKRYGLALALVGLALTLRGVLPFPEGAGIYQLPLAAVVLSAWYGGRGPGLLASLIAVMGAMYLLPPANTLKVLPAHVLPLSIFSALCLLLTEFSAGRRRVEHALRASEERFRTLVRFSFDAYWYWETDAQHRFTRQEFAHRLTDAPPPNPSIGKTRWEVPYLEPDEEGWRKHRAMLDAHLPFRDFELARPGADGRKRYMAVSGMPVFDGFGQFVGYRGVGRDITERKRAEDEHRQHVRFLESMDRVNRAIQGTNDLEQMLGRALDEVLDIFQCDRAVLGRHSGESETRSFTLLGKRERPAFVLDVNLGEEVAADEGLRAMSAELRAAGGPVQWVLGSVPPRTAQVLKRFGVQSVLSMPIEPKAERRDHFHVFTLRQCTHPRVWTPEEVRLFVEIGRRLGDATTMLSTLRDLRSSERKLEGAQSLAHVGWWERDYGTGRVSLSEESCRIFGVQPVDLPHWHGRWLNLIHPDDRALVAAASESALGGGPRYDVEYRVIRPDGTVRVVHSQGDVTRDESGRPVRQFGAMQDITELRRAEDEVRASEAALRESEARFRTFVDRATDAFFLLDEELNVVDVNRQACEGLGWRREELIAMHPGDFDVGLDASAMARLAERAQAGEIITFETRHRRKDGTVFPVEIRTGTFEQGGRRFYLALARDISERNLAEESLRQSEAYLTEAQRLSHTGSWALDVASNRYVYTSVEFDRIFGFDPQREAPTREAVLERMHPEDRSSWKRILEKSVREKLDTTSQYRIVLPDGRVRHIHTIRHPVVNSAGEVVKLVGTSIDITERKRAEEELRASEQRYRTLFEKANDAIFLENERDDIIEVNERACTLLGYSRNELLRMKVADLQAPEIRGQAGEVVREEMEEYGSATFESVDLHRSGRRIPVEVTNTGISDRGENLILSVVRDISERKRAEESLQESAAYLAEAQRLSHTGSWALDVATSRYVYTSEESDRIFGFDPQGEKPTREAVFERLHPEDRSTWKRNLEKSLREKVDTFDQYRIVLPDGRVRHIHTIRHPVMNSTGEVVKLVGTSIDITERKRAEEEGERLRRLEAELAHANRVNTLGELTTSIVHEVSQPLGAMMASAAAGARWLAAEPPDLAEARSALQNIAADGKRAREVIGRIRALTKREPPQKEPLDVNQRVLEVLALANYELKSHDIVVRTQLDRSLPRVAADRVQLQQVLLNLIVNAIEAMGSVHDRSRELTIVSGQDGPNGVVVEVRDSGTGLVPEGTERVFEAFYTTKAEGIGIGLSISRSIVEAHAGRLWASANEPHGAVFRFSLPVVEEGQ